VSERDAQIARAVERARERAGTTPDRDAQISEAMERVRERVQGGGGPGAGGAPQGRAGGVGAGGSGPGGAGGGLGNGFGTGDGTGELRGADFLLYYNEMIARVRDAWVWAGGAGDLEVKVAFGVTADGDIVGLRLVQPSGDRSYDESVMRALRAVRNLGPPPERHRAAFADVELTFRPADLEQP
jgi:colicin import membrane protein